MLKFPLGAPMFIGTAKAVRCLKSLTAIETPRPAGNPARRAKAFQTLEETMSKRTVSKRTRKASPAKTTKAKARRKPNARRVAAWFPKDKRGTTRVSANGKGKFAGREFFAGKPTLQTVFERMGKAGVHGRWKRIHRLVESGNVTLS